MQVRGSSTSSVGRRAQKWRWGQSAGAHLEALCEAFGRVVPSARDCQVLPALHRVPALVLQREEGRTDEVLLGVARRGLVAERDKVCDGRHGLKEGAE